jgi:hypothetical protein
MEVAEGGVAGAEVVQVDPEALLVKLLQLAGGRGELSSRTLSVISSLRCRRV